MCVVAFATQILWYVRTVHHLNSSLGAASSARPIAAFLSSMTKAWPWLDELRPRDSHEHSKGVGPGHFAYVNGPKMHGENSGNEPNGQHENAICTGDEMVATVQTTLHHQMKQGPGSVF